MSVAENIAPQGQWRGVEPDEILAWWPSLSPLVRRALMVGDTAFTERSIAQALLAGQWRIWAYTAEDDVLSICISEVIHFPQMTKLWIRYIAGEWEPFENGLSFIEGYARGNGCRRIEAHMRRGLTRKLPPDWTAHRVIMVRELD